VVAACGDDSGSKASTTTVASGSAPTTGSPTTAAAPTKSEIVVGNIGLYSGPFGPQYKHGTDSLDAYFKELNAKGGINGHPVKLIVKNDDGDPAKALAAVKEMVETDHIVALVGNNAGATDAAFKDYVEQKKIPVIGGLSTTKQYGTSPMFFPASTGQVDFLTSTINGAKLAGGTKLGGLVCAEQAACQQAIPLFKSIADKIGIGFVGAQAVAGTAPNYTAQCVALRDAGADIVYPATAGATSVRIVADCARQNFKPKYVFSGGVFTPELITPDTEGSYVVSGAPLWFGDEPFQKDFHAALKKDTNFDPDGFSSRTWQAGLLFTAAAKNVGDTVTANDILEGLYALKGETLGGWAVPLTYVRDAPNKVPDCDYLAKIQGGKLVAANGYEATCVK
jgi:branched-chain amino acid transport system substrate-binding protein